MSELFTEDDVKYIHKDITINKHKPGFFPLRAYTSTPTTTTKILNVDHFEKIHEKIKNDPNPNHYYNKNEFNEIYAISDIHADYKALLRHLVKFNFIEYDEVSVDNIDTDKFDIYNPKLISDVKWVKKNTLLVICGDIVNGSRTKRDSQGNAVKDSDGNTVKNEVNDKQGTFEILLHMFLRNLKIQAQTSSSDVMLIVGKHDYVGVWLVQYYVGDSDKLYEFGHRDFGKEFVHSTAINLYKGNGNNEYQIREKILSPFYRNFSLFFGITNNNEKPIKISNFDILFIHGGIRYNDTKKHNFYSENIDFFMNTKDPNIHNYDKHNNVDYNVFIDQNGVVERSGENYYKYLYSVMTNYIKKAFDERIKQHGPDVDDRSGPNAIWANDTDDSNDDNCEYYKIEDKPEGTIEDKPTPTIVVSHRPTEKNKPNDNKRICSKTDYRFCIYPKCFIEKNGKTIPKVVNIDTSMSGAFIKNTLEKMQAFEMLKISKENNNGGDFDKYTTVSIKNGGIVEYDLQNVSKTTRAGKTRRRKRKSSNKSKRSKQTKKSKQTHKRGRKTRR